MGFLDILTGGGPAEVKAKPLDQFGVGISDMMTQQAQIGTEAAGRALTFGRDSVDLIRQTGDAPTLGAQEKQELNIAEDIYSRTLKNAQLNIFNQTAGQIGGGMGNLAAMGVNLGGAGAQNLASSVTAKNQASLNDFAAQQSQQLLGYRQELLGNVYNRLLNRTNLTLGQQAAQSATSSSVLGNLYNIDAGERSYQSNIDVQNAQIQQSSDAAGLSMLGGLAGSAMTLGGSYLSGR